MTRGTGPWRGYRASAIEPSLLQSTRARVERELANGVGYTAGLLRPTASAKSPCRPNQCRPNLHGAARPPAPLTTLAASVNSGSRSNATGRRSSQRSVLI